MREGVGGLVDRAQAFAARHSRAIGWLSTAWLVLVGLSHAGFVPLPKIEILESRAAMIASIAWNGAWWGFVRPALERRRLRAAAQEAADAS